MKNRKQAVLDSGIFRQALPELFPDARATDAEQILVRCPFHADTTPSLSVNTAAGLHHCFSCGAKGNGFDLYMQIKGCDFSTALADLEALAGITPAAATPRKKTQVVACFDYRDAEGNRLYFKKRFEPGFDGRKKSFAFYHLDTAGKQAKGRGCDPLPYNLHLLASTPAGAPVFFLEGEAKADALTAWGLVATSLDSGGQSGKGATWRNEFSPYFADRDVVILPDNDKTGEQYAATLAAHLLPVAASVKVLRLPGLPTKGDILDWIRLAGGKKTDLKERFLALVPEAEPVKAEKTADDTPPPPPGDDLTHHQEVGGRGIERLLPMLEADPLYYCTDDGTSHILRRGRLCLLSSKNQELIEDLRLDGLELTGKAPARETVITAIDLLCARARRDGHRVELFNRVGERGGLFYYDMGDGRAVEVSPGANTWRITDAPVMFRRMRHQKAQATPKPHGDPARILEFCNLPPEQRLLAVVTFITCFVPRIFHPAIHISGCQGSGKSLFSSVWKTAIDPSSVLLSTMPRKPEDLDLLLVRYYGLALDNLSALSGDTCDRLCSFITGGTIEKRTLHTDLETTILRANSVIFYSSIGSLHSRPDLTERTIVFELGRIPDEKRMPEAEIREKFWTVLPEILGGTFNMLSRAMDIFPHLELERLPRMADFAKWGYAIAEAMGGRGDEFLRDYAATTLIQSGSLLERDTLFASIVQAMDDPAFGELNGSFHEVLLTLMEVAAPGEAKNGYRMLEKDRTFPSARGFRKHLERIRMPLEGMGIGFEIDDRRTSRGKAFVTFYKKAPDSETPAPENKPTP